LIEAAGIRRCRAALDGLAPPVGMAGTDEDLTGLCRTLREEQRRASNQGCDKQQFLHGCRASVYLIVARYAVMSCIFLSFGSSKASFRIVFLCPAFGSLTST